MTTRLELTAEQKAIVRHPLTPLRVAAGAGTGKTTTIAARLAAAISAGLEPEQALGITFTNKAAEELADRLRSELSSLAAEGREVEVTTYHGFAFRIITELGALVGVEHNLDVIGPGYVRELLHESIGSGPYHHLDLTATAWRVDEAAALGTQLAANLLEPEDLEAIAPGTPSVLWGQRLELAHILRTYRSHKRRLGVVDYGDLIQLAHRLVTDHPEVADRIRQRYRIVVLDEYQDTDPSQRQLLRAIFGDGFPVTAVGDEDQTIYEWRGASRDNFAAFDRHFPDAAGHAAPTLPLSVNRRSGASILGMANAVRQLLHGAPPADPLRPAEPVADSVECGWFRTAWDEASWIAGEVRRLHDDEAQRWGDIAVLFRKNRQIPLVRDALHDADVPIEVVSLGGLLGVPEVADVHAWLSILGRPDDSVALARILLGPRFRLGLGDIAPLAAWSRREHPGRDDDPLGYPLVEAIDRLDDVGGLSETARERLDEFRSGYRTLLGEAQGVTLVELVSRIIDAVDGWAEIEAMPEAAAMSARLNLYRFLDLVEDWSPLAGRPSLDGFLGYLDLLAEERAAEELDTARVGGQDAVALLTVHRAKGLEWDTVFVPALASGIFPATSQGFDDPLASARWLPYELRIDAATLPRLDDDEAVRRQVLRTRHLEQERRTAYVAVTRPRRRLVLTGAAWYEGKQPRRPSEILELTRSQPGVTVHTWVDDPGPAPEDRAAGAGPAPDPHLPGGWRAALRAAIADAGWARAEAPDPVAYDNARRQLALLLDDLPQPPAAVSRPPETVTSVTGLVTLASCPQRFSWSEIDRLPRRPAPWLRHGTEIHRRIELHHRGVIAFPDLDPDTPEDSEVRGAYGVDPFASFAGSRFAAADPALVETPIDIALAGTRIRGRIDAVFIPEPGTWEVVDYKSGRPSDDPTALVQLQAYAVAALDGAVAGGRPERLTVTFAFLGADPVVERRHEVDEGWLAAARTRLSELATMAQRDVFPATPGPGCRRCDFTMFCEPGRRWLETGDGETDGDDVTAPARRPRRPRS